MVEVLVRARPTTEEALNRLQVSKFSASTRQRYGASILVTFRQVRACHVLHHHVTLCRARFYTIIMLRCAGQGFIPEWSNQDR